MTNNRKPVANAIAELKANLDTVARVREWAELMGYENTRLFSRHFLKHFKDRPKPVLIRVRLQSIVRYLQLDEKGRSLRLHQGDIGRKQPVFRPLMESHNL